MSIRMMMQVEQRKIRRELMLLLMALTDITDDDAGNVFPSVDKMAEKTRASRRMVQRNLHQLVADGVLVEVRPATRNFPAEYLIALEALQPTPEDKGRQSDTPQDQGRRPVHSGASSETNEGRHGDARTVNSDTSKEARAREREFEEQFEEWYQQYPRKVSRGPAEKALRKALGSGVSLETSDRGRQALRGPGRRQRIALHQAPGDVAKRQVLARRAGAAARRGARWRAHMVAETRARRADGCGANWKIMGPNQTLREIKARPYNLTKIVEYIPLLIWLTAPL